MPAASLTKPTLSNLYWGDYTIRRSFSGMIYGLVLAAGIGWLMHTTPPPVPPLEAPMELVYFPWVCGAGLLASALCATLLVQRYLLVMKILSHGDNVQGSVEEIDIHDTNMHSDSSTSKGTPTYAYYVTIGYAVHGIERKKRFKLLHSPSTYGIKKEEKVVINVLPDAPNKPLIRAVYFLQRLGKKRWFL